MSIEQMVENRESMESLSRQLSVVGFIYSINSITRAIVNYQRSAACCISDFIIIIKTIKSTNMDRCTHNANIAQFSTEMRIGW